MEQRALLERLARIRGRVRLRLALYGSCAVVAGGFAAFLTCVTLDWLLWLPWALRITGAVLFVGGFVWAVWRWVIRPLRATLGLSEIADQLERRFAPLADRLTSTVEFLQRPQPGSPGLVRHVVADTERMVEDLPLETTLSVRPLVRQGAWCVAVTMVFLSVVLLAPEWAKTGAERYLDPLGRVQWPHDVTIVPETADVLVPLGESVTLRMSIARGLSETLRGVVHLREPDGTSAVLAMQRDGDGIYSLRVDSVTRDMQYWFEAGDDSTQDDSGWIRVVRRPEVIDATVRIEAPPYASHASLRVLDLADGPVSAPLGGHATVRLRASKSVPAGSANARTGLRLESGELIPLEVSGDEGRTLSARLKISRDLAFRAELHDADGFTNRGAARYVIRATPDMPPAVTVVDSAALLEITPNGIVPVEARVTDDFGITDLELYAEQLNHGRTMRISLSDRLQRSRQAGPVEATALYMWDLAPLALAAGEVLSYRLIATDNFSGTQGDGQEGQSPVMRIKIISDVEFAIRMQSELALMEKRLRQAVLDQKELLDHTQRLLAGEETPPPLEPAQRATAARTASGQIRLIRNVRELATRLLKLADQMEQNRVEVSDTHRHATWLGEGLAHAANDPMRRAVERLNRMLEQADPAEQQTALGGAADAQTAAVAQLESLITEMGQWGDFQSLTTKAQDLLGRQESLRARTAELGRSMLGKAVEALSADELRRLKRTKREQEQVGDDVERLLARMRELRADPKEDPAGAQAVESALRAAAAHELMERVRRAAGSIESNRTAAAAMDQRAVGEAIRKMIAALEERDERQLEELRKRVVNARQQLAELIDEQEALHAATREAGLLGHLEEPADRFAALGDEQRRLRRNTAQMGREWSGEPRLLPASAIVQQAARPMSDAEEKLHAMEAELAAQAQEDALASLHEAVRLLDEVARQTAEEAMRRTLAQIREELQNMRDGQLTINGDMGRLKAAMDAAGRLERRHAREATRLSREQGEVRAEVHALLPELEKVVVYRWAMERVAEWMEATQKALYERRVDGDTTATAARIVAELDKLIGAIERTAELPMDREFEESAAGDSGAAAAAGKPVPTVAELLVLKTMQEDINERAKALDRSFDVERATERQLQSLEMLGEDQREVRRLTELVTNRARQP